MDAERFDAISRALGTQSRRRGMLRAAAGGALGMVGISRLSDSALAAKCKNDNDCDGKDVCKNGKCVECKNDDDCKSGEFCDDNTCVECLKNKDCKKNQRCKNNQCKKKS